MTYYAYLWVAHSIQGFVINSTKLAEMVGASELLELLLDDQGPFDSVLGRVNQSFPNAKVKASRRGGGAVYLITHEKAALIALRDAWQLVVAGAVPGLPFADAIAEGKHPALAIEAGQKKIEQQRNTPEIDLPEAGPLVRRAPRSGLPATKTVKDREQTVWVDRAAFNKLEGKYGDKQFSHGVLLDEKYLQKNGKDLRDQYVLPRNLDASDPDQTSFPFKPNSHYIGIIHADGNGLGQMLINLKEEAKIAAKDYADVFLAVSKAIDKATTDAARAAVMADSITREGVPQSKGSDKLVLPVRPLILGGDDLTIIVRGDLALDFTARFLEAFEKTSKKEFEKLRADEGWSNYLGIKILPEQMTACAGVALLRSNQPFALGYQLAESLCSAAKRASKQHSENPVPSSLVFHRVTSSLIEDYTNALDRELGFVDANNQHWQFTLGAYGVGQFAKDLPPFAALADIKQLFSDEIMARGPTRQFMTMMKQDSDEAKRIWQRWRKHMAVEAFKQRLANFDADASALLGKPGGLQLAESPFIAVPGKSKHLSFLGDLIAWLAVTGE